MPLGIFYPISTMSYSKQLKTTLNLHKITKKLHKTFNKHDIFITRKYLQIRLRLNMNFEWFTISASKIIESRTQGSQKYKPSIWSACVLTLKDTWVQKGVYGRVRFLPLKDTSTKHAFYHKEKKFDGRTNHQLDVILLLLLLLLLLKLLLLLLPDYY